MVGRKILDENRHVVDAAAEFFRQRIQRLFGNLDKLFAFHPSPLTRTVHLHRVASVILIIVVTFIVRDASLVILFVLFLVRFFPKKDIGSRRAIRIVWVEALSPRSAHVHMVLCARWQGQRVLVMNAGGSTVENASVVCAVQTRSAKDRLREREMNKWTCL